MRISAKFPTVVNRFVARVLHVTRGQPRYVNKVLKMLHSNPRSASVEEPLYRKVKPGKVYSATPRTITCTVCGQLGHNARRHAREGETPAPAVAGDDAGGAEPPSDGPLPDPEFVTGSREVCRIHGWVGKLAFYRDKHDTCEIGLFDLDAADESDLDAEEEVEENEEGETDEEIVPNGTRRRRKSPRQLGVPRKRTVPTKQLTKAFMRETQQKLDAEERYQPIAGIERPMTRADCVDGPRPCPWVSCRHHLYLEVNPITGSITFNRPDIEPWEMEHSCSLDEADSGHQTLEQVGFLLNVTRERTRQLEVPALDKLRSGLAELGIHDNDE